MTNAIYDENILNKIDLINFKDLHIFHIFKKYINDIYSIKIFEYISKNYSKENLFYIFLKDINLKNINNNNNKIIILNLLNSSKIDFINIIKSDNIIDYLYNINNLNKTLVDDDIKIENKEFPFIIFLILNIVYTYYKLFGFENNTIFNNVIKNNKNNNKFIPYPSINDNNFNNIINSKEEFKKYKAKTLENVDINDICSSKNKTEYHKLQNHQKILRNYINPHTPYNNLLIFHGTGAGKTCAAISIAENHISNIENFPKVLIIYNSTTIRDNFRKELYNFSKEEYELQNNLTIGSKQCTGDRYYVEQKDNIDEEERQKKVFKNIKKYYEFKSTTDIVNDIKKIKKRVKDITTEQTKSENLEKSFISNEYDNRLIIIDECHTLKKSYDSGNSDESLLSEDDDDDSIKSIDALELIIKQSSNIKLILMSATPMHDKPNEIIDLFNLFLLNQKKDILNESDIFNENNKTITIKKEGYNILKDVSKGIVSYYRGNNPVSFPTVYEPNDITLKNYYNNNEIYLPTPKYSFVSNEILKKNELMTKNNLVKCTMTKFQNDKYKLLIKDIVKEVAQNSSQNLINFIYPIDNKNNVYYGEEGLENAMTKNFNSNSYSYKSFNTGFLTEKNVKKYSIKYFNILQNVKKSPGIAFIYFEKKFNIYTMAMILEEAGYVSYNKKQVLLNNVNKNKICSICNLYKSDSIHDIKNKNVKNKKFCEFKQATYIILTGDDKSNIRQKYIQMSHNSKNIKGEELKIYIVSKVLNIGADFGNIRQIHFGNLWHNMSRIYQIIGRGSRFCSHSKLDKNNRNLVVFKYCCTYKSNEKETVDEKMWRDSEKKDKIIKEIERLLKENSIDCDLNYNSSYFDPKIYKESGDKDNSRECDYTKCNIKCNIRKNLKNDSSTIIYDKKNNDIYNEVKYYIKNYFIKKNILSIDNILTNFKNYIDSTIVLKVIDNLLGNNITIYPETIKHNNDIGHLVFKNNYLIFKSINNYNLSDILSINYLETYKENNIKLDKIPKKIGNKNKIFDMNLFLDNTKNKSIQEIHYLIEHEYYNVRNNILDYILNYTHKENITILSNLPSYLYNIIKLYKNNLFRKNIITNNPNDKSYFGYVIENKFYCLNNKDINENSNKDSNDIYFKECNFDNLRYLNDNFKIHIDNREDSNIYGLIIKNKDNILFKIVDKTIEKKKKRIDEKFMKSTIITGKVCETYDKPNLNRILEYLKIDTDKRKLNREKICKLIELKLREYENSKKDNLKWFYNLEESLIKNKK